MTAADRTATVTAPISVALVGRQNAGKTSLHMHLTGSALRPVNFPGTSVERVEGMTELGGRQLRVADLPGIASLSALSRDEAVAVQYLRDPATRPDVLCAVLDASKLTVELRLLESLLGLELPVVVALNKGDVARSTGQEVDADALSSAIRLPVVVTDGLRGRGLAELRAAMVAAVGVPPPPQLGGSPDALAARVLRSPGTRTSVTDRLDAVLLHPLLGLPILLAVIFGMFQLVYNGAEPFIEMVESGQDWLAERCSGWLEPGALHSFLVDGLINGVGSIVVFVPQIALLIALVTVLEASGYMARAAFLLDRVLRRVGLSGRSFVPLTTSFACAIPGILASRIITDERDRIATIVVSPLMSCSARLPVYVVLIGAFFPVAWAGVVLLCLYLLGIAVAAVVALFVRRTVLRGGPSHLMMELPAYQLPSPRVVWIQVRTACREFAVLAGTVILSTSVLIWLLSYYPRPADIHARFEAQRQEIAAAPAGDAAARAGLDARERAAYLEQSYLARFGKAIQPVFAPAGFDWRTTVGVVSAFPARELIIPTLGILYSLGDVDAGDYDLDELRHADQNQGGLRGTLEAARGPDGKPVFNAVTALALMVFFALCSQCVATLGAIRRETHSWRWPVFTFCYMTALAWTAATLVYQVGTALGIGGSP